MISRLSGLCQLLAVIATNVAVAALAVPTSAAPLPRFEATSCDLPDILDLTPRVRCGIVRVPRDHAHPNGSTYALAVVLIASAEQPTHPDPVVYISGGPGGPLTIYAGYQARHPYAAGRDLILVDQRGMGRSEPRLCPEMQGGLINAMLAVATDPTSEALAADRAAHAACRDAIRARGIELDTFGTAATADDYEWVRQALGIKRWNVVGESYGTTVAMTLLARHPEAIRSAVLDSLNPPDRYFGMPWSERVASARESLLAASRPDLTTIYRNVLERLKRQAPSVPLPPALQVPGNRVRLTPSLLEEVVGRLIYYLPFYPGLPHLIEAARDGDMSPVGAALTVLLAGAKDSGNEGAFVAVECRDRPRWRESGAAGASPLDLALLPPGVCPDWSAAGPEPEVPQGTSVPTLVLQGQFDPNIRPDQSRRVTDLLGRKARLIEFTGIGHSVRHYSLCAAGVVTAFIARPDQELHTACATSPLRLEPSGLSRP
jgi:pimeloyl-ACP methyl ester carboxylesterase